LRRRVAATGFGVAVVAFSAVTLFVLGFTALGAPDLAVVVAFVPEAPAFVVAARFTGFVFSFMATFLVWDLSMARFSIGPVVYKPEPITGF
jgi:hypothetical protein